MSRRQYIALFLTSLILYTTANGLLPLLPIYARKLEDNPALIGNMLALAYVALAAGTLGAGWWSDLLQRRKVLLVAAGVLAITSVWLMGQVDRIWPLIAMVVVLWFLIGIGLSMISLLAGMYAGAQERGRVFGILTLTISLGSLLGGATMGKIADRWGYPTLFTALALFQVLWPLAGLLVEDRVAVRSRGTSGEGTRTRFAQAFSLLLAANLLVMVAYFSGVLGRSLAMSQMGFDSDAVATTVAISGLVTLPLPPLLGWLSDRVDRKYLIILGYLIGSAGLVTLALSSMEWHFQLAFSLLSLLTISYGIGSAFATDLLPPESLSVGLPLFSATAWGGGIVGFFAAGYTIKNLPLVYTFYAGAALPLVGILLLFILRRE
jgi:MFS family permease